METKDNKQPTEVKQNVAKCGTFGEVCVEVMAQTKEEQERTTTKKRLFLETWARSSGVIHVTCQKVDINRETFRRWCKEDEKFALAVKMTAGEKNEIAEDILWGLVTVKRHPPSVQYYLDRRDDLYKPKNVTEVIAGDVTLDDLLKQDDKEAEEKFIEHEQNKSKPIQKDEQPADRGIVLDPQQTGNESTIQVKPSPAVVLGTQNKKEPDIESKTGGA